MSVPASFELTRVLEASEPPEARGLERDHVRLLVARRSDGQIIHAGFRDLPEFLDPGDLLVINTSATLAAAVAALRADGSRVRVHFATRAPGMPEPWFVIELRSADGARPIRSVGPGERLRLDGGGVARLVALYASGTRLMLARIEVDSPVLAYLDEHGEAIRYGHVHGTWPLHTYQTAYATTPGSAEMPSAGRPFTPELITALVAKGVLLAPLTLHAGVSSPERDEPPFPEYYDVSEPTARLVAAVRGWGGRVVAVGTTVVRALETVAAEDRPGHGAGWTNLVIGPGHRLRAVDGLITGWHEPEASHLRMLEALAGKHLLDRSYRAALEHGYLWHEFGDSHLILP